ncbi:MAG: hypothetical protein WCL06_16170 [Bacteroidota bacterium]
MSFFQKIQEYLLTADLKKELLRSARDKKFISFDKSRSIGILYKVGEEKDQIEFSAFVTRLKEEKKEIKALGMIKYKDIPHYCYPKLSYDYVTTKNINWIRKPTGEKVSDFINKPFDILINFDTTADLSLNYIAGLSIAKCKVGIFHENNKAIYDLMIETDNNCSFKELSAHYLTYINMIAQNN